MNLVAQPYPPKSQSGFTIVELITMIIIVGILSSVSAPRFVGNDAFAARGAYTTILSGLRFAQKTAVAQRTVVYAVLDTSGRTMCIAYDSACANKLNSPVDKTPYDEILTSGVTLTTTKSAIAFTGSGQESSNNTVTITVQNNVVAGEPVRTITIEQDSGYVH